MLTDHIDLVTVIQVIGPALAVYVAIRVDIAAFHVRLDHLERDLYKEGREHKRRADDRSN